MVEMFPYLLVAFVPNNIATTEKVVRATLGREADFPEAIISL